MKRTSRHLRLGSMAKLTRYGQSSSNRRGLRFETLEDRRLLTVAVGFANGTTTISEDVDTSSATKMADIVITDDSQGTYDLALSGPDAGLFQIESTELRLRAGATLDFETNPNLDVTAEVTPALVTFADETSFLAAAGSVVVESFESSSGSQLYSLSTPYFEIAHTSVHGFKVRSDTTSPFGTFATDGSHYLEEISGNNEFRFHNFTSPLTSFGLFITDFGDSGTPGVSPWRNGEGPMATCSTLAWWPPPVMRLPT